MIKKVKIADIYSIFKKYGDVGLKVNTPYGYKHIEACDVTAKDSSVFEVRTSGNKTLRCSPEHKIKTKNGRFKPIISTKLGTKVQTIDGVEEIVSIEILSEKKDLLDIQVADVKQYYSNGIVSHNSSLMDALCFTIFDKSARAFKATHVINSQKMSFSGKFTFEINDVQYVIERKGVRDKKNNVKVDVNFYKIEKDQKISLNSEARRSTNEIIRDYLGSYDDFILTSVALQGNQGSFIDMGQTERKELLSQFIGLNVFDRLSANANDTLKEITGAIKTFNKENNQQKIESLKNESSLLESKLIDLNGQKEQYTHDKQKIEDAILAEQAKIVTLENVPTNVTILQKERQTLMTKNTECLLSVSKIDSETNLKKKEFSELSEKLKKFPTDLKQKNDSYNSLVRQKQKIQSDLERLKAVVNEKLKKLEHLDKHEYDPNCSYCCNNIFVKDAIATRGSLVADKNEARELSEALINIKNQITEIEPAVAQHQESVSLRERVNTLSAFLSKKELEHATLNNLIEKNNNRIIQLDNDIDLYEKSKEVIENNRAINEVINELKEKSNSFTAKLKKINNEYVEAYSRKVSVTDQVKNIEEQIEKNEKFENEQAAYQYYLTAIGKDGVPYKIISDVIPKIEQEVNNILSQIVEFTMGIETDGKNVNVYIKYDDKKWPLELCSGMEKFISALALRVALVNVSNLPRSNFLVVDEGMSALDSNNMPMLHSLFDYLKTNFEFIIIISHLDVMRDMVNKQLEIKKENGFSKIDNTV